ncbi:hypothetical protein F511_27123 [Dorcoceras hygrometricum]|uniref:Uncharacterized protein n=1 Tax=Dorcoceras hygrometricum TaxID=472368 RepID=A0A2Z7CJG9_9LAMI|nr:hypothetical protein F511_27123 [Dorcoceras hygrometricum]
MNIKQSPSRCLLFLSLKPAATTSRSIHEKTSQNYTIPTNLNDIVKIPAGALLKDNQQAPGSDQFHEGIDPSTVERLDQRLIRSMTRISTTLLVCTRKPTKVLRKEYPCRDDRNNFQRWRRVAAGNDGEEGKGGGEEKYN